MKRPSTFFGLLLITAFLHAQTWVRQNPFENLSQMHDVDFDGKYGIAVGADATIFATIDGGTSWDRQIPSPLARDITAAKVVPGTYGQVMLAGGDSIMMVTHDGGQKWKTSYVEIPNIYKIQILPGNVYLALGKDFGIYSVDNGYTWQPFNMPAFGVTAGHFTSIYKGWVALGEPDNVKIWYTDDGGFSWEVRDPQIFPLVNGIEMINDTVGFLASKDFVYKTYDGGFLWFPLHGVATDHIQDLFVIDENNLWSALDDGSIFFSNSGGSVWEEKVPSVLNRNRVLGIWANGTGKVWAVGKYMSILYSSDFGQTWTDQLPATKQTLLEPNFENAFTGMVGGADGVIMKTTNSGATWQTLNLPIDENFFGTFMLNDSTVIVGSTTGKVYITEDQGLTWQEIGDGLEQITDLHAFSPQVIIVSNKSGDIYKTTNGGAQWDRTYDGSIALHAMTFYNATSGWAAGANGRIITTNNGGDTWNVQWNDFGQVFSDIFMTSPLEGWVTSSKFSDSIWHTTDGGITWETEFLPIKSYWNGVSFMDKDTGWVVGGDEDAGIILRTNDRGQTWLVDHVSPDEFKGIYSLPNSETVWAVGYGGNIMKFSSCASPPLLIDLRGNLEPCIGDTLNYIVEFDDVDLFHWTFPSDWHVLGNTNTASIHFIAGSTPGIVTVQGSDACGDTTDQLTALITPVEVPIVRISEDNGFLVSNTPPGLYQWFLNGVEIPGANDPFYKPTVNGTYQMHYTTFTSGCEGISNIFRYGLVPQLFPDIDELRPTPNPADGSFTIYQSDGSPIEPGAKIIFTHIDGRISQTTVSQNSQINIAHLPAGLYSIQVLTDEKILAGKVLVEH